MILALFGSSRPNGNSELLADRALEGVPCDRIYLRDWTIHPIEDRRHDPAGFQPVDDDYDRIIAEVLAHQVLVFVTPVYWYGVSGPMKNFFDRWSQVMRDKRFDFKAAMREKQAYVIAVGGDKPRFEALPMIQQLKHIFDYVGMEFAAYVIGKGNRPGEVLEDQRALADAAWLRQELLARAEATPSSI